MSKLIYKSEKPYTEDLNDLVEDELEKGRGPDKQPRKQRGSLSHIEDQDASDARRKEAKARVNAIVAARTAKMTDAQRAKMRKSDDEMDINDLVEQDMNHEETFYKGGVGSGKRGHTSTKKLIGHIKHGEHVVAIHHNVGAKAHAYEVHNHTTGTRTLHHDAGSAKTSMESEASKHGWKKKA